MSLTRTEGLQVISGASGIRRSITLDEATRNVLRTVNGRTSEQLTPAVCSSMLTKIAVNDRVGGFAEALTTNWALREFPRQRRSSEAPTQESHQTLRPQRPSQETIKNAFRLGRIIYRGTVLLHRGIESANLGRK